MSRSLVLKLSKSGSGIWAPNSLSLDHIWKSGFPKTYKTALRSPEATIFSSWRTERPASVSSAIGEQILQWEGVDLVRKKRRKD